MKNPESEPEMPISVSDFTVAERRWQEERFGSYLTEQQKPFKGTIIFDKNRQPVPRIIAGETTIFEPAYGQSIHAPF